MHVGRRYELAETLSWTRDDIWQPAVWAALVTLGFQAGITALALPWLPMSSLAVAVAFYLGFKNSASYDRTWEGRKIWGAIVNASRSWAFSSRDLVRSTEPTDADLAEVRRKLVMRHVAWLDAFRHQLREVRAWEHQGAEHMHFRQGHGAPEYVEDLRSVLRGHLPGEEVEAALQAVNPAAHLLSAQSRELADLRARGLIDGWGHQVLQELLIELMTQQGKAERIKNFPFPRQYATVNRFFAVLFSALLPCGLLTVFAELGPAMVWLTIPFSTLVSWVFLTTDRIGDWSENPFEGLANDVPISALSRAIERDIREMDGQTELPPAREPVGDLLF